MRVFLLILLILFSSSSYGEIYRWVDENGQVHFGNSPPKLQKPYKAGQVNTTKTKIEEKQVNNKEQAVDIIKRDPQKDVRDKKNQERPEAKDEQEQKQASQQKDKADGDLKVKISPRTDEEKELEALKERERNEKFNALIKRLKDDLGAIKNPEPISGQENTDNEGNAENDNNLVNQEPETIKGNESENEAEIGSVEQVEAKNNEKCGFFMSYVENYKERIRYECPDEHCDLLQKNLEKFQNKVKQYCVSDDKDEVTKEN